MSRLARSVWTAALLVFSCGVSVPEPRAIPPKPKVPSFKVGAGYVVTELPEGKLVGVDANGKPVQPKVSDDFKGVPTSNQWWSSLIWQHESKAAHSLNLYAHPLVLRAGRRGLGLSYPSVPSLRPREYMYRYAEDLVVGLEGLKSKHTRVSAYSDWAVTAEWSSAGSKLDVTFGHGLPFVYAERQGQARASITVAKDKVRSLAVWSDAGGALGLSVGDRHYGLFAPPGARWERNGERFSSDLRGERYFSVAVLPNAKQETLDLFEKHAFAFVRNTRVSFSYDEKRALLENRFDVETELVLGCEETRKEEACELSDEPLLALYRHQWLHTDAPLLDMGYASPRGRMKLLPAKDFTTKLRFNGVLPVLPHVAKDDSGRLRRLVSDAAQKDELFPKGLGEKPDNDAYWEGKSFGRLANLLELAHQLELPAERARLLTSLQNRLADWFDGHAPRYFYYDSTWRTLVGFPDSYGSASHINDHHFHYGYFVWAAAVVARHDPGWARTWGPLVEMLIRDAANWDRAESRFPFLRYMDVYAGHSWANGPAQFEEGNNQEASSEDINFSAAVMLWGAVTDNRPLRDLGIFLYANQVVAVEQYWFDVDDAVFPKRFDHPTVAMVWGAGAKYDTWFAQDPILIHGINFLPFTGASLYLGRRPDYVKKNFDVLLARSYGQITTWRDYILMFAALGDAERAWEYFERDRLFEPEFGNSMAMTEHWLTNLKALGRLDSTITADSPFFAVFANKGRRSHVAFNPSASPTKVKFSDGTVVDVPSRGLVVR